MRTLNTTNSLPEIKHESGYSTLAVYPRLHFFSLDLSNYIGILKHGSFGLSLQDFPISISCTAGSVHDKIVINGGKQHYDLDASVDFDKLRRKTQIDKFFDVKVSIPDRLQEHTGIGISTQIVGGIYLVCAKHCGIDLTINDLFDLGVGHVSTLGLNLLFNPGMIVENGVSYKNGIEKPVNSVTKIENFPFWIIIAVPKDNQSLSAKVEDDFWNGILPENVDITKSVYREFYGECLPAVIEADFETFAKGIDKIVPMGSKKCEEEIQSPETKQLLANLRKEFGCAGVSSLGPTVYSFANQDPTEQLKQLSNNKYDFYMVKP